MANKQISFPVTDMEHEQIKQLAAQERRKIKQLVFDMLDKVYPNWDKNEKINDSK